MTLLPLWLAADEPTFASTLTAAERAEAGLANLDDNELASLNAQVGRELKVARLGDVVAFAGTFSTRRPASEHQAAGLAKLSEAETAALDRLVARALAQRRVDPPMRAAAASGTAVEIDRRRGEWHGEVSMTYGRASGGHDFYGGSVTTIYEDRELGWAAALTLSRYEGDGLYYGGPYCFDRRYSAAPYGWRR